ncbi:hypothetical protein ACOSP7_022686 [Xanthoceras sorbifolium]
MEYLDQVPTFYEDFLSGGVSQCIEMDKGMDLRHTLLHHAFMSVSLAYKDVLETEKSEAKRRELRDELGKARRELAAGVEREKWLVIEVHESKALRKVMELGVKESVAPTVGELIESFQKMRATAEAQDKNTTTESADPATIASDQVAPGGGSPLAGQV